MSKIEEKLYSVKALLNKAIELTEQLKPVCPKDSNKIDCLECAGLPICDQYDNIIYLIQEALRNLT